jgi:hypothetical protein
MAQGRATGILPVKEIMARACPDVFDRDGHATSGSGTGILPVKGIMAGTDVAHRLFSSYAANLRKVGRSLPGVPEAPGNLLHAPWRSPLAIVFGDCSPAVPCNLSPVPFSSPRHYPLTTSH